MDRGVWRATVHRVRKSSDTTDLAGTPWNLFPLILSASAPNRANGSVCGQTAISALLGWDQLSPQLSLCTEDLLLGGSLHSPAVHRATSHRDI